MVPPIFRADLPHLAKAVWKALNGISKGVFVYLNLLGASQSNWVDNQDYPLQHGLVNCTAILIKFGINLRNEE
jgi:hypothetical protein